MSRCCSPLRCPPPRSISAVAQLNKQLVGSAQVQLKARSYQGVPERLLAEVRSVPGVQTALPILERQVNVIGNAWRAAGSIDRCGTAGDESQRQVRPSLFREAAAQCPRSRCRQPLDDEIGEGPLEPVQVQVGAKFTETLMGATLGAKEIGGLIHSPIAVTSIDYAQRLTGCLKW